VGKIYNLLSTRVADNIASSVDGVKEAYVRILSQIGSPIDHPKAASVQLIMENGITFESVKPEVESIVDVQLAEIKEVTKAVIKGELCTF